MTESFTKHPSLRIVQSDASPEAKESITQNSNILRMIDREIDQLPDSEQKSHLSTAVNKVREAVGQVFGRLLGYEKAFTLQQQHIICIHAILKENLSIMQKLHSINKGLGSGRIDTIADAILYIEQSTREQFPGISTRIILSPRQDEYGTYSENPIAQMLADTIEMTYPRFSDEDSTMTPQEIGQKTKIDHLASLLPLSEDALKRKELPGKLRVLSRNALFTSITEPSHILTPQEISGLDSQVFGTPGSALAHSIPKIGEIIFLSDDPYHYNPEQDTLLIGNAVETLGMLLTLIGKNENNTKDLLTGLSMRRSFEEKVRKLFEDAKENGANVSFILIDIDHFKQVNNLFGAAAGDFILKIFAKILVQELKAEDIQVRWGGEEFGVFMQTDPWEAARAIQRVFDVIKKIVFQIDANGIPSISNGNPHPNNITFSITLSAGIAGNKDLIMASDSKQGTTGEIPFEKLTLEDVIRKADERLYATKNGGRDHLVRE